MYHMQHMMMVTWHGGRLGDMYHREQYCHCRRWTLLGQAHIAKDVFTILHTNNETALY